jgi:hypothetical protein
MSPEFNGETGPSGCASVDYRRRDAKVIPREAPAGES